MPDSRTPQTRETYPLDYGRQLARARVLSAPRKRRASLLETVALVAVIVVGFVLCACLIAAAAVLVLVL